MDRRTQLKQTQVQGAPVQKPVTQGVQYIHSEESLLLTQGAAKYRQILQKVEPRIVIVEEAAEVLEAHTIATLSKACQHLILIGDHQQVGLGPPEDELTLCRGGIRQEDPGLCFLPPSSGLLVAFCDSSFPHLPCPV